MNDWRDQIQLTGSDPTFNACEAAALLSVLGQRGIGTAALLAGCGLPAEALRDPALRISLQQHCALFAAGAAHDGQADLLPRVAQRLHLTAFGIAGYALLASQTLGDLIRFADLYAPLLNLKFSLQVVREGRVARLVFADRYLLDAPARAACAVLELGKVCTLLRDVLGTGFAPRAAHVALQGAQPGGDPVQPEARLAALSCLVGCPVQAAADTQLCFDAALLDQGLAQSNAATFAACQQVCDQLMTGLASRFTLERHIRDILLKTTMRPPRLEALAETLCMSQRTLRRRLDALDTSYQQILEDVRKELALRYLLTTHASTEDIAMWLGYSDAANFRHAFKRWTGRSPKDYRAGRAHHDIAHRAGPAPLAAQPRAAGGGSHSPAAAAQRLWLAEAAACWATTTPAHSFPSHSAEAPC